MKLNRSMLAVATTFSLLSPAFGAIIDFNTLASGPLSSYTENGFTVTNSTGQFKGGSFGNPGPSIFGGPEFGPSVNGITLTEVGGGLFSLNSFDFSPNNGTASYTITGFLNGNQVYSITGSDVQPNGVFNFDTRHISATLADTVEMVFSMSGTSANVDNIVLTTAVPEPSTWAMIILGFLGVGYMAYRKRTTLRFV